MGKNARSIRWNTVANFFGLTYTSLIGIVVLPFYLRYLGAESFGLIGFFILLQSVMQLFDGGMSPLLSRQAAKARGDDEGFLEFNKLLNSLELSAMVLATILFVFIAVNSAWISQNWLNIASLNTDDVEQCLVLMGAIIGLRLLNSLWRSGIQGMENHIVLNSSNMAIATIRYLGAYFLVRFATQDIVLFFLYQLFVGVLESIVLRKLLFHVLPIVERPVFKFYWITLKPMLPFSLAIAYTAGISVLLTHIDKLVLSKVLPLSEYGYFALVGAVSAGMIQISNPISQAILPRMTFFVSQNQKKEMLALYRKSTQIMAVIVFPVAGVMALFANPLLYAWTGDRAASDWGAGVLFWFALGNGVMAIGAFQYYLQFATGNLRMHVAYNSVLAFVQIPIIILAALKFGAIGVAIVWFSLKLVTFIFWTPIVHSRFAPGIHASWLLRDILPILLSTTLSLLFFMELDLDFEPMSRLKIFYYLAFMGIAILAVNSLVSRVGKKIVIGMVMKMVNAKFLSKS